MALADAVELALGGAVEPGLDAADPVLSTLEAAFGVVEAAMGAVEAAPIAWLRRTGVRRGASSARASTGLCAAAYPHHRIFKK